MRVGGGASHRSDLASGVLLKDNHIALVGSVREAVRRARANAPHVLRVVVEVDDLAQLDEALEAGAEGILLDNFQVRDMAEAVKRVRERRPPVVIEASGGVTLDRIHEISKTGVDVVSIGIAHALRARDRLFVRDPADRRRARTRLVGGVMGGGRWGWAAALAIAAGAGGCDEGGAPARGFHSRQLVSIRDPTLSLVSFGSKIVTEETDDGPRSRQVTDPDVAYYTTGDEPARTYWKMNLIDGTVTELGEPDTSRRPQPPRSRRTIRLPLRRKRDRCVHAVRGRCGDPAGPRCRSIGSSVSPAVRATPIATWPSCGWTKTTWAGCGPDRSTAWCARSWISRLIST